MQQAEQAIVYLRGESEGPVAKDAKVASDLLPPHYTLALNRNVNTLCLSIRGKVVGEARLTPAEVSFFFLLFCAFPAFLPDKDIWNLGLLQKRAIPSLREKLKFLQSTLTIGRLQGRGYMLCSGAAIDQ